MKEFDIINDLLKPIAGEGSLGLNDDCAIIPFNDQYDYVVNVDGLSEGIHLFNDASAKLYAEKLIAANVSDIAAMGATPSFYFLQGFVNKGLSSYWHEAFTKKLSELNKKYNLQLLGGDTVKHAGNNHISCTMIGIVEKGKALIRSNAKADDYIYISGELGNAYKYFDNDKVYIPESRVQLAQELIKNNVTCATDISDGLMMDLESICTASQVGAEIYFDNIPVIEQNSHKPNAKLTAINFGEDFELIFTSKEKLDLDGIYEIGRITKPSNCHHREGGDLKNDPSKDSRLRGNDIVRLLDLNNHEIEVTQKGYEH